MADVFLHYWSGLAFHGDPNGAAAAVRTATAVRGGGGNENKIKKWGRGGEVDDYDDGGGGEFNVNACGADCVEWPRWGSRRGRAGGSREGVTLALNLPAATVEGLRDDRCDFWDEVEANRTTIIA